MTLSHNPDPDAEEYRDAAHHWQKRFAEAERQRVELLAVLESIVDGHEDEPDLHGGKIAGEFSYWDLRKALSAIANAKGQQP